MSILLVVAVAAGCATAPAGESLFNGKDLSEWRKPTGQWQVARDVKSDPADEKKFAITPGQGVIVNGPAGRTVNLLTATEHGDVEAHIE
ncbi:MAG: hypothetical protein ACYTKD_32510, partial [Planctomycetota bacterium]